jgi:hypothetical protein
MICFRLVKGGEMSRAITAVIGIHAKQVVGFEFRNGIRLRKVMITMNQKKVIWRSKEEGKKENIISEKKKTASRWETANRENADHIKYVALEIASGRAREG